MGGCKSSIVHSIGPARITEGCDAHFAARLLLDSPLACSIFSILVEGKGKGAESGEIKLRKVEYRKCEFLVVSLEAQNSQQY